jgi:hypothetical protein
LIGPTSLYSSYTVVIEANADRDVAGFAPTTAKSFNVMKVADSHDLWLKGHRVARYELRGGHRQCFAGASEKNEDNHQSCE